MLVVNDDGIHGPGLRPLVGALRPLGLVEVVVPNQERSTASHALTLHRPIRVQSVARGFHMMNGLPSDCARFGILELLKDRVDLVVSGVNAGLNIGEDVLYSGTVAAAMEGTLLDVPSIALSLDVPEGSRSSTAFTAAARFAAKLARKVLRTGLPGGVCLNVNFPSAARWRGVRSARLCKRLYGRKVHSRRDPRGKTYYWLVGENISAIGTRGSDAAAIDEGFISITPLRVDMTDDKALPLVETWGLKP